MIKIPEARKVDVREITPSPRNTKKHPQSQINNVAKSIERFGFVQPLVLDDHNEIIIGHCRLAAAKKLGMKQVPCVYVEDLSEEDIRALRILDNKLNESDWDFEILADELKDLDFSEFEELDFGIEEPEKPLDDIVEDEPPALEEEAEPTTQRGDVWQLGNHRLMCGDSANPADVQKLGGGGRQTSSSRIRRTTGIT